MTNDKKELKPSNPPIDPVIAKPSIDPVVAKPVGTAKGTIAVFSSIVKPPLKKKDG